MTGGLDVDRAVRWWVVAAVTAGVLGLMAVLLVAADLGGTSVNDALSDQVELTEQRFLAIVTRVGVVLWGAVVTVCLFTAVLLGGSPPWRRLFVAAAALTAVLLVDDMLAVHEYAIDVVEVFAEVERSRDVLDLTEGAVFAVYGTLGLAYLVGFRDRLRFGDLRLLAVALGAFAASTAIDLVLELPGSDDLEIIVEEGAKLLGICFFGWFHADLAVRRLRPAIAATPDVDVDG